VPKSIHRPEYRAVVGCLVAVRKEAGLTQVELAARLRHTQGWVSAVERGDSRLDLLQVHDWCRVCGLTMEELGRMVDEAVAKEKARSGSEKKASARKKTKRRP
jgi:transcriptional regulator with XRE-family HTH domain